MKMKMPEMNWKAVSVEVFAAVASYLILMMTPAAAANIRILYGGSSTSVTYNPEILVSRVIEPRNGAGSKIFINISSSGPNAIETVYVYRCRGYDPADCARYALYESQGGGFSREYAWSEIANQTSSFPQKANIMTLVKFIDPLGSRWAGYWDTVTKQCSGCGLVASSQPLGDMDIYAIYGKQDLVKSFIENRKMIPFNPSWVERLVFAGKSLLYELNMNSLPDVTPQIRYGSEMTGINKTFSFVFPKGDDTASAAVLNLNPNYTCGDNICNNGVSAPDLGETPGGCCYDCGCYGAYYCDSSFGCRAESQITLSVSGTPDTRVSNCNVHNYISIGVRINNPPTGLSITGMSYMLNGTGPYPVACTGGVGTGHIYTCNITVPPADPCSAGDFLLSNNNITFDISYPDGPSTSTKHITAPFPDITIGSWVCGQFGCESGLGENQNTCCYDCGCPSGKYCDFETGRPNTSACRIEPGNANLVISNVNPSHFSSSDGSETVSMAAQITNRPHGMSTPSADCRIDCTPSCTASCSVSCSGSASSDPGIYNSTCGLSFVINSYSALRDYTLYPVINNTITFNTGAVNGTVTTATKTLSAGAGGVTVGIHYCGDGNCTADENQSICCYDCGCASGQYCDTLGTTDHRQDSCMPLLPINLTKVDAGPTAFIDSFVEHYVNVTLRADHRPSGAALSAACGFNNSASDVACSAQCGAINESDYAVCRVIVPPINQSATGFYNPATKKITLPQNVLDAVLSFNNGHGIAGKNFSFSLPTITIDVVPHCGDGICESDLGESASSCCADCPCQDSAAFGPGYWCYTGRNLNGECIRKSDVLLDITGFDPSPLGCTIFQLKGKCMFVEALDISAHIVNAAPDLGVVSSFITYEGKDYSVSCFATPAGQTENYTCSFAVPELDDSSAGAVNKNIRLALTVRYNTGSQMTTQNISASSSFSINKAKSEALKKCEEEMADIDKQISKLERDKTLAIATAAMFWASAAVLFAACAADCGWCCTAAAWLVCIATCITAAVVPIIADIQSKIDMLKSQRKGMCEGSSYSQLKSNAQKSLSTGTVLIGLALGVLCVFCLFKVSSLAGLFKSVGSSGSSGSGALSSWIGEKVENVRNWWNSITATKAPQP